MRFSVFGCFVRLFLIRMRVSMRFLCMLNFMTATEIGAKVRARRKLLRLRQRDLAELAGVTLRGLTDLETGNANPTIKQLMKIATVLGLEIRLSERTPHAEG